MLEYIVLRQNDQFQRPGRSQKSSVVVTFNNWPFWFHPDTKLLTLFFLNIHLMIYVQQSNNLAKGLIHMFHTKTLNVQFGPTLRSELLPR
jgi:hypothetical protein